MPTKTSEQLTSKETDIWHLLAKGLMYKEIAHQQGVTIDTIKKHSKNIYRKLNVRNRTEAVTFLITNKAVMAWWCGIAFENFVLLL